MLVEDDRAERSTQDQAVNFIADLLRDAGREEDALIWYLRIREPNSGAMLEATDLAFRLGREDEAIAILKRAFGSVFSYERDRVVNQLREAGHVEKAIDWYFEEAGSDTCHSFESRPIAEASSLLRDLGRSEEAIIQYRTRSKCGDTGSMRILIGLLREEKRDEEAMVWLQRLAETDDPFFSATNRLAALLYQTGRAADALIWYQRAAESGNSFAARQAAELLRETGGDSKMLAWLTALCQSKAANVTVIAADLLREAGYNKEALVGYELASKTDFMWGMEAARLLIRMGDTEQAINRYRRFAEEGIVTAMVDLADLLCEVGRTEEAIRWYMKRAQVGTRIMNPRESKPTKRRSPPTLVIKARDRACKRAIALLRERGRTDEAVAWLARLVETNNSWAIQQLIFLLREIGHAEKAEQVEKFGIEPELYARKLGR